MKRLILILAVLLVVWGPLAPVEVRAQETKFYTTPQGSNTNSGSTTNQHALFSFANGNWDGNSNFICAATPDLSGVTAGMWAAIMDDGVTNAPYFARIVTVNDGTDTITILEQSGSGTKPASGATGKTLNIGGALRGPTGTDMTPFGVFGGNMTNASGHPLLVNMKGDMSEAADYIIQGPLTHNKGGFFRVEGYTNDPGDIRAAVLAAGNPYVITNLFLPTIHGDTNGAFTLYTPFNFTSDGLSLWFICLSGGGSGPGATATNEMVRCAGNTGFYFVRVRRSWRSGIHFVTAGCEAFWCEGTECNIDAAQANAPFKMSAGGIFAWCFAHHNAFNAGDTGNDGFFLVADNDETMTVLNCISAWNNGSGLELSGTSGRAEIINFTAYRNTQDGIRSDMSSSGSVGLTNDTTVNIINLLSISNGLFGARGIGATRDGPGYPRLINAWMCANTNGPYTNIASQNIIGGGNLSEIPFNDADAGDFSLKPSSAAIRAGLGVFLQNTNFTKRTLSFPSAGAAEPTNTASASITVRGAGPFIR